MAQRAAMKPDQFLTTGDVARHCGYNVTTVGRWIKKGLLRAYQFGPKGHHRIRVTDFIDFCEKNNLSVPEGLQPERWRVLIVDDEPMVVEVYQESLKLGGYQTEVAESGFDAAGKLHSFMPHVMVLDLNMPGMNGMEVIRRCRAGGCPVCGEAHFTPPQILVVTALGSAAGEEAIAAGANAALVKPLRPSTLRRHVQNLLQPVSK